MAVKNRFRSRLNPRALDSLRYESHTQGLMGRRAFLVGATALGVAVPAARAATKVANVAGYRMRKRVRQGKLQQVSFEAQGQTWTVDPTLFAGSPVLTLAEDGKAVTVTLVGAKFPGTDTDASFTARITPNLLGHVIRLELATGIAMEAPFSEWIKGDKALSAKISKEQASRLFSCVGVHASIEADNGSITYTPQNELIFVGSSKLKTEDAEFALSQFTLLAEPRSEVTLASGKTRSHTTLTASKAGVWDGEFAVQTKENWHVEGLADGFSDLRYEIHEGSFAALVLNAPQKSNLKLHVPDQIEFQLENARLARMFGVERDAMLVADISDSATWIHMPGYSAELGPKQGTGLRIRMSSDGYFEGEPELEARRLAPSLEDAVVTTPDNSPLAVTLTVGQTRPIQKPRPIITPVQKPILKPTTPAATQVTQQPGIIAVAVQVFIIDIARRLDMVALRYQFVNLSLGSDGKATSLTRTDPNKPAYVIVTFPPQSVAESTFDEDTTHRELPSPFNVPIETRMAGPSRLVFFIPATVTAIPFSLSAPGGLLDWSQWRMSVVPTAKSSFGPKIVVQPGWKEPLSFEKMSPSVAEPAPQPIRSLMLTHAVVPNEDGGQLTRTTAVQRQQRPATGDISAAEVSVIAKNIDPTRYVEFIPTKRIKLGPHDTAIEMPTWMYISPNETARWFHALQPVTHNKRTELWHTRLGSEMDSARGDRPVPIETSDDGKWYYEKEGQDSGPYQATKDNRPTVRAVDAVDYDSAPIEVVYNPAMDHTHRLRLVNSMTPRAQGPTDSRPFVVERLMLTALGGYLKGEWNWAKGTKYNGDTQTPETIAWRHVATLGRDHFVKLVDRGFLFPSGHKAVMITISERKFNRANGGIYAVLRKRQYIEIIDPVVIPATEAEKRNLGFQSLTCLTRVTPDIDMSTSERDIPGVADTDALWVMVGGKQFHFNMRGVDMDGQAANWNQSAVFVYWHTAVDPTATVTKQIINAHQTKTPPGNGSIAETLDGHHVSFVPSDPKPAPGSGGARYPCQTLSISGNTGTPNEFEVIPNFRPMLYRATLRIPAVEQLQGKAPPPSASIDEMALDYAPGWTDIAAADSAAGYYLDPDVLGDVEVFFADMYKNNGFGGPNTGEAFFEFVDKKHASFKDTGKSGGIANPNIGMLGLSRIKGPISGKVGQIGQTIVDASDYFPQVKALVFGAVNLWDLLPKKIDIGGNGTDSPKLVVESIFNDGKTKPPTDITTTLFWMPKLSNFAFSAGDPSIFKVDDESINGDVFKSSDVFGAWPADGKDSELDKPDGTDLQLSKAKQHMILKAEIKVSLKSGDSSFKLLGEMRRFRVDCIAPVSFIWLDFRLIRFAAGGGEDPKIQIDMPATTFTGPLAFVQTLQDLLSPGGNGTLLSNTDTAGLYYDSGWGFKPYCDVTIQGVKAGFTLTVPDISVGILAIRNISLGASLNLPFLIDPLRVRFNFCERNNPFALSVWGITGGGFIAIALGVDGVECFEGSLEFGGSLSLNVGVASGSVSIMAGIYFKIDSVSGTTVTAYIRLDGNLNILGIIDVSLEFYLSLTYHKSVSGATSLIGTATMSVSISILFFSFSVSVTVQKEIAGSGSLMYASTGGALEPPTAVPIPFYQAVDNDQFLVYCSAFGAH